VNGLIDKNTAFPRSGRFIAGWYLWQLKMRFRLFAQVRTSVIRDGSCIFFYSVSGTLPFAALIFPGVFIIAAKAFINLSKLYGPMKILLVEDDAVLADGLIHTLTQNGYRVSSATSGSYAESLMSAEDFDLVILDLGLPDMDGLELLRKLRHRKVPVPIMILTARDSVNDKIVGIEQGADDYLTKPFELRELEARVHALIRRCYGGFRNDIVIGQLTLDTRNHQVLAEGQPVPLSRREYSALEILLLQAGKVVCKDRIGQRLSADGDALTDNAIEIYIHRLRKRIRPYGAIIRTVRGLGYLLERMEDEESQKS
jgi:two-component system OmpR family response regulator